MNLTALIAAVKGEGGFDVTDGQATAWINSRYQRLVAESRWYVKEISLGPTVSGTSNYALSATVVHLDQLRVGNVRYDPVSQDDLWRVRYDDSLITGPGGVFAQDWDSSGASTIELYPVPTTSGDTITGLAALLPTALSAGSDVPVTPADFDDAIIDGAVAVGLARVDEDLAAADRYEARFDGWVQKLGRRKNSRAGRGPTQIQISGVHF